MRIETKKLLTPKEPFGVRAGLVLLLAGYFLMVVLRILSIRSADASIAGCVDCLTLPALVSDLRPLGVLLGFLALAWAFSAWAIHFSLGLAAVIVSAIYLVDLCIYKVLGFRLLLSDFLRYGSETGAIWSVGKSLLFSVHGIMGFVGFLTTVCGVALITRSIRPNLSVAMGLGVMALVAGNAVGLVTDPGFVNSNVWRDVITNNEPSGVDVEYSVPFKSAIAVTPPAKEVCDSTPTPAQSVILVVIESLSLYHSHLQSGLTDSLPELDRLAQSNSYLQDFHANGFSTDGGLIALLTGNVPLPNIGRYQSIDVWTGFERSRGGALERVKSAGYGMQYFTSANLEFLGAESWLSGLGFDHIEGPTHPAYANLPRGSFGDPGDQALYDRYLSWYDKEKRGGPHFSVVQTISTHPPFAQPGSSVGDELESFRVADKAIGAFVRELEHRGYFKRGILMVTGDHRSMTPRRLGEWSLLGKGAMSRVPAVIIGNAGLPRGPVGERWQQVDFLPSLLHMAGLPSCTSAYQGRFLGPKKKSAQYVFHVQGAVRERVSVWPATEESPFEIQLSGDASRWVTQPSGNWDSQQVLTFVNHARSQRPTVPGNFAPILMRWYHPIAP